MRRPNLWIIGVDENEDFQFKGRENIFKKIIEENFPYLKKETPINIHIRKKPTGLQIDWTRKEIPPET